MVLRGVLLRIRPCKPRREDVEEDAGSAAVASRRPVQAM
jgi:hypothetical protein